MLTRIFELRTRISLVAKLTGYIHDLEPASKNSTACQCEWQAVRDWALRSSQG
jgi:hypothetical protein